MCKGSQRRSEVGPSLDQWMLTVPSSYTPLWSAHTHHLFFTAPPALTARTPSPTEQTLPFTVPWRLLRRSWEGRPAPFHIYASDAAVISLWLDGSPPRPQEERGDCPRAATVCTSMLAYGVCSYLSSLWYGQISLYIHCKSLIKKISIIVF